MCEKRQRKPLITKSDLNHNPNVGIDKQGLRCDAADRQRSKKHAMHKAGAQSKKKS